MKKNKDERRLTSGEETKKSALSRKKYETSDERRSAKRVAQLSKQNERREARVVKYGSDSVVAVAADFNKRFVAAFMALVFALSVLVVGVNFATKADDETANLQPAGTSGVKDDTSGMVLNKYLTAKDNGKYDLTLESYSTAELKNITEKVPTDFVVIVDQSGSMATTDMATAYSTSTTTINLEDAAASDYYVKETDSNGVDHYYRVYPVRGYMYKYYAANTRWVQNIQDESNASLRILQRESDSYSDTANQYYYKTDDGVYRRITFSFTGKIGTWALRARYTNANGTEVYFDRGSKPVYKNALGSGKYEDGDFGYDLINGFVKTLYSNSKDYTYSYYNGLVLKVTTGMYINYDMYKRWLGYTKLCYRDANGVEHTLTSDSGLTEAEYCNAEKQAITTYNGSTRMTYSGLYASSGTKVTRLKALETALNGFVDAVANEEDSFGAVDNRIAIVGFSSKNGTNNKYNNTELFTGVTIDSSSSGYSFSESTYYFPYKGANYATATSGSSGATNYNGPQYYSYSSSAGYNVQVTNSDYANALVSANNGTVGTVNSDLTKAIKSIGAYGGTQPEDGFVMAKNIYEQRSDVKYTMRSGNNKGKEVNRNTIVIFFTDGQPGNYDYSNRYEEANEVVQASYDLKHYTNPGELEESPIKVFSIGVFGESDGNPLTYRAHTETTENSDLEYDDGFVEMVSSGSYYYYLNRYWLYDNVSDYGPSPTDTIFDYMSVVSSNYPDATNYVSANWATNGSDSNYSNWLAMIATERNTETASTSNDYYRMAADQASLVDAFEQAVTIASKEKTNTTVVDNTTVYLKDVLNSSNFETTTSTIVTYQTDKGTIDDSGNITFDNSPEDATGLTTSFNENNNTLTVSGFDYSSNYIALGKDATGDLEENQGRKLIVTIKDIVPNNTGDLLYSNNDGAGIYSIDETNGDKLIASFPQPSISRHSYKLDILGENKKAQFNVFTRLVKTDPNASDDLSGVIVVKADGTRINYSPNPERIELGRMYYDDKDTEDQTDDIDRSTYYYENVPTGYQIATEVEPIGEDFTYYAYYDDESSSQKREFTSTNPLKTDFTYSNHVIHISSEANSRTVIIKEAVDDSAFANQGDKFVPEVYIEAPTGVNVDETATFGETEWVKDGENRMVLKDPLIPIKADEQQSITLTLPSGWKLFVDQTDDKDYSVKSATYKVDTTEATSDYAEGGWNWSITKDATITITNTRPSIPVEGINNSSNHNWIIYILVGIAAIAVIAGGIFLWKKRNEFVEE